MRRTLAAPLALVVLILLASSALAETPAHFEYVGQIWQNEPAVRDLQGRLPEMWKKALADIERNLGIHYEDHGQISVELDDIGASEGHLGTTSMAGHPRVTVFLLSLMEGRADLQEIISHELTHAIQREKMGKSFEDVPLWIAEGLAVYASDAGPPRVRLVLMGARSPRMVLDGLESLNHTSFHYAEDYLAFERMKIRYGPQSVIKFTAEIMQNHSWQQAVSAACGESPEEFVHRSYDYAADYVDKLDRWTRPSIDKSMKALDAHKYEEALARFDSMLEQADEPMTSAFPKFYKGVCLFNLNRRDEARKLFQEVSASTLMSPEGTLYLGHCEAVEGHNEAAIKIYESIHDRYPASYRVPAAMYHASHCLEKLGKMQEARDLRAQIKELYPQSLYVLKPPPDYSWLAEVNPRGQSDSDLVGFP